MPEQAEVELEQCSGGLRRRDIDEATRGLRRVDLQTPRRDWAADPAAGEERDRRERKHVRSAVSREVGEDAINDREPLGLTWSTVHRFLRLGSNPAFAGCMSDDEAMGWVEQWLDAGVELLGEADLRWELFIELVGASPRALRNSIDDAYLAAVAIARGATLASFDRDLEAFVPHGLRLERLGPTQAND